MFQTDLDKMITRNVLNFIKPSVASRLIYKCRDEIDDKFSDVIGSIDEILFED